MIPRYLMDYLKLLPELTVILMIVFSTSSIKQCGPKTIVTIRNVGIKLCQLKCTEHGLCRSFEYDIETLTCRLSRDDPKKTEKKEGDVVPNGSCASMTCNLGQRCLKTRSGKAVCVQDEQQNYPERPLHHEVNKMETLENNPLHEACRKGDLGRVRRILSRDLVDVNGRDKKHGRTPLMVAAQKGHRRVFDFLIRKGANVSQVDDNGFNILHWAGNGGHVGMVKYVLTQHSVDINSRNALGKTSLMNAAYHGYRDVFDVLVCMGANVSQVDDDGNNLLHWACVGGHVGMVKYLLSQHIIDINSTTKIGRTTPMKAVYYGHVDVLQLLVSMGANVLQVDDDGDNILHYASIRGHAEIIKYILSEDMVNINSRGKYGRTPLMRAAYYGHRKAFDLLVGEGGRISLVDDNGDNILHFASLGGHVEVGKHILSRNMTEINARDRYGETAAMAAKRRGQRRVYNLLVSRGCPVQ